MKQFLRAVILGGVALLVGAFFGLLIDGVLEEYKPGDNATTEEVTEYENSIISLMIDFFLPMYMLGLIVGVIALILNVAEVM